MKFFVDFATKPNFLHQTPFPKAIISSLYHKNLVLYKLTNMKYHIIEMFSVAVYLKFAKSFFFCISSACYFFRSSFNVGGAIYKLSSFLLSAMYMGFFIYLSLFIYAYFLCFLSLQKNMTYRFADDKYKNTKYVSKTIDFSLISAKDKIKSASKDS